MVGLTKEQVLQCMGPPANRSAEGSTEVWSYNSGNGHTAVHASASSDTMATGSFATTSASGVAVATKRFCTVNVAMIDAKVVRVAYAGPTGGVLTAGEQCAFAVQNCVRQQ